MVKRFRNEVCQDSITYKRSEQLKGHFVVFCLRMQKYQGLSAAQVELLRRMFAESKTIIKSRDILVSCSK